MSPSRFVTCFGGLVLAVALVATARGAETPSDDTSEPEAGASADEGSPGNAASDDGDTSDDNGEESVDPSIERSDEESTRDATGEPESNETSSPDPENDSPGGTPEEAGSSDDASEREGPAPPSELEGDRAGSEPAKTVPTGEDSTEIRGSERLDAPSATGDAEREDRSATSSGPESAPPEARGQARAEGASSAGEASADESESSTNGEKPADEQTPPGGFSFGSYGRVQIDFDEDGNVGRQTNVVAHGPRILEGSYAELDLRYRIAESDGFRTKVLFTLALLPSFAHFDGDFENQSLAVRNLYAETSGFVPGARGLGLWVGSRMYRGNDVYLLDYWPMDELNTVGGGAVWRRGGWEVRTHVGVNRLDDDYQFQTIEVPSPGHGVRQKVMLERQRAIASARTRYQLHVGEDLGAKAVLYGEYHSLPSGERISPDLLRDDAPIYAEDLSTESLPSDRGSLLGAQLGLFDFGPSSHVNLFFKWARGLAAYGEFGVPFGRHGDGSAEGAQNLVGALSANWETRHVGLMAGGYLRRFNDADGEREDLDDFFESAVAVRPLWFITDHIHQGLELSYQTKHPFGLEPASGEHRTPRVFQASLLEIVGLDRGSYKRPQLRLQYTVSVSNEDARELYPTDDRRRPDAVEHFIGFGAEWWFNSSRY